MHNDFSQNHNHAAGRRGDGVNFYCLKSLVIKVCLNEGFTAR